MKQHRNFLSPQHDVELSYDTPHDSNVEYEVLAAILNGAGIDPRLDADCFYNPVGVLIFCEAKRLHDISANIDLDIISDKTDIEKNDLLDIYYTGSSFVDMDNWVKTLVQKKFQRLISSVGRRFIESSINDSITTEELLEKCENLYDAIEKAGNSLCLRNADNDWYVFKKNPDIRFKVLQGKYGKPDYCRMNEVTVPEQQMLDSGYERITIENTEG